MTDIDFCREKHISLLIYKLLAVSQGGIRHPDKGTSFETRYFISSLDPDKVSASEFQNYILGHWEIEHCLHGQKDKEYQEDKHVLGPDSWGEVWTVLTNMGNTIQNRKCLEKKQKLPKWVRKKTCSRTG